MVEGSVWKKGCGRAAYVIVLIRWTCTRDHGRADSDAEKEDRGFAVTVGRMQIMTLSTASARELRYCVNYVEAARKLHVLCMWLWTPATQAIAYQALADDMQMWVGKCYVKATVGLVHFNSSQVMPNNIQGSLHNPNSTHHGIVKRRDLFFVLINLIDNPMYWPLSSSDEHRHSLDPIHGRTKAQPGLPPWRKPQPAGSKMFHLSLSVVSMESTPDQWYFQVPCTETPAMPALRKERKTR